MTVYTEYLDLSATQVSCTHLTFSDIQDYFVFRIKFQFDIFEGETYIKTLPYQAIDIAVCLDLSLSTVDEVYEFLK